MIRSLWASLHATALLALLCAFAPARSQTATAPANATAAPPTDSPVPPGKETEAAVAAAKIGLMRIYTAAEFAAAMAEGVRHMVIQDHLDLTQLPTLPGQPPTLFRLEESVQSMQVRGAALRLELPCNCCTLRCRVAGRHSHLRRAAALHRASRIACRRPT